MNNQFVPIQKMSKKIKNEYYREKRGNWVNINPCTKVIDDKTNMTEIASKVLITVDLLDKCDNI